MKKYAYFYKTEISLRVSIKLRFFEKIKVSDFKIKLITRNLRFVLKIVHVAVMSHYRLNKNPRYDLLKCYEVFTRI